MMAWMKTVYEIRTADFVKLASSWFRSDVQNLYAKLHFLLWHITLEYKIRILPGIIPIL